MILLLITKWLFISTFRFIKLFNASLGCITFRLNSIPRFILVALLSIFALLISYLHLFVVFIEHIILTLFTRIKHYPVVFILGPPRSGTTRMHKLLATDHKTFSSMKMWELFFAPAVSQKLLLIGLSKVDKLFGAPFFLLIQLIEKKAFKSFNRIHELGLFNVEEDGLILFHLFSSYHLSFLLGKEKYYEHLNYDKRVPKAVWAYYKICVDNHMRINPGKIFLSKNPFFSGSSDSLNTLFKNPKFIHMNRDMNQVAPSFFSLKNFFSRAFYGVKPSDSEYNVIFKTLLFWSEAPANKIYKSVTLKANFSELTSDPISLVKRIYRIINIAIDDKYKEQLRQEAKKAKNYKSEHKYSASDYCLEKITKY